MNVNIIDEGIQAAQSNKGKIGWPAANLNPYKKGSDDHYAWEYGYYQGSYDPEYESQFNAGEDEGCETCKSENIPSWPGNNPYPSNTARYYGWDCGYAAAYACFIQFQSENVRV